jgi:hypothetical protein
VQPEHVLAYALHYYRIVDRDKALSAIDYAAEELPMKGLCEIALDGDIKLTPPGLAQAKRLVQMPTADPVRVRFVTSSFTEPHRTRAYQWPLFCQHRTYPQQAWTELAEKGKQM